MDKSDKRFKLWNALKNYKTEYESEKDFIPELIKFVEDNENCFERTNLAGHVTGSAWILNPTNDKALMTHHKKLNLWLQLGGHSDGDANTWNVALREANEESGINDIDFISEEIFDIDIHPIPENLKKGEPKHFHYDVRFLLRANNENFVVSDESNSLKWVEAAELKDSSTSISRMVDKWTKI